MSDRLELVTLAACIREVIGEGCRLFPENEGAGGAGCLL